MAAVEPLNTQEGVAPRNMSTPADDDLLRVPVSIPADGDDDETEAEQKARENKARDEKERVDAMLEARDIAACAERDRVLADFEAKLFVRGRVDEARKHANELFQQEKLTDAASAYTRILPLCEREDQRLVLRSNLAAVRLKQWRWRDALTECDAILAIEPTHQKALYRKAQAYRGLRETETALATVATAKQLATEDGKGTADLDALERNLRADVRRAEEAKAEAKAKEQRLARRQEEFRKQEAQKQAASASGVALSGRGPSDGAGCARNWSEWFRGDVVRCLTDDKARMMVRDWDGWVSVQQVPLDKLEASARIVTSADGTRELFYDLRLTLLCQCAQMRGTWDDPGCLAFTSEVLLDGIDNATRPEDWHAEATVQSGQETGRVKKMMEANVRPEHLPHVKGLLEECIGRLRRSAEESLMTEVPPAEAVALS